VSAGNLHSIATKTNGEIWATGYNTDGELGNGTTTNSNIFVQSGTATNWASVAGGGYHNIALKTDGSLSSWGANPQGQLGDGTTTNKNAPTAIACPTTLSVASNTFENKYAVYPNPVKDILNFDTEEAIIKIAVYDLSGRMIFSDTVLNNTVDVSNLKTGSYVLKAFTKNGVGNAKIVKE
jgi:alpha-tubulin suppressor-like RCC1 family protein